MCTHDCLLKWLVPSSMLLSMNKLCFHTRSLPSFCCCFIHLLAGCLRKLWNPFFACLLAYIALMEDLLSLPISWDIRLFKRLIEDKRLVISFCVSPFIEPARARIHCVANTFQLACNFCFSFVLPLERLSQVCWNFQSVNKQWCIMVLKTLTLQVLLLRWCRQCRYCYWPLLLY